ncbi:MAG: galactosyldiacylglycerol synthase [Thermoleophilia bacterium]|nr:galactosyldiacylglycerol synthase [Thermoleophilia bacterium]
MITLSLKDGGAVFGTIDEADLQVLIDQLVEETDEDTDYYVNSLTIELLERNGASARLVGLLKDAVGDSEGVDIVWQES